MDTEQFKVIIKLTEKVGSFTTAADTLTRSVDELSSNVSLLDNQVQNQNARMQTTEVENKAERELDRRERALQRQECQRHKKAISAQFAAIGVKNIEIEEELEQTGKTNLIEIAKRLGKEELKIDTRQKLVNIGKLVGWTVTISGTVIGIILGAIKLRIIQ